VGVLEVVLEVLEQTQRELAVLLLDCFTSPNDAGEQVRRAF
jgi:hypothetical protein